MREEGEGNKNIPSKYIAQEFFLSKRNKKRITTFASSILPNILISELPLP